MEYCRPVSAMESVSDGLFEGHRRSCDPCCRPVRLTHPLPRCLNHRLQLHLVRWRERATDLLPKGLRRAPQPCRATGILVHGSKSRKCLQRVGNAQSIPQLPKERQAVRVQRASRRVLALSKSDIPQLVDRTGNARFVPRLPVERQTLLDQRSRRRVLALGKSDMSKTVERVGNALFITQLPIERQALLVECVCRHEVALRIIDSPQAVDRTGYALFVPQLAL